MNNQHIVERIHGVSTEQLIKNFDNAVMEIVQLPKEWLPEDYQQKRAVRTLRSIDNQYRRKNKAEFRHPMETSVKFETVNGQRSIVESTPERLERLERYSAMFNEETETPIEYEENEYKLYKNQLAFARVMVETGVFDEDDFIE